MRFPSGTNITEGTMTASLSPPPLMDVLYGTNETIVDIRLVEDFPGMTSSVLLSFIRRCCLQQTHGLL